MIRNFFSTIFFSPDERRLRAGWRLSIQTILFLFLASIVTAPLVLSGMFSDSNAPSNLILQKLIETLALFASLWVARRFLDRRTFTSLGHRINALAWRDLFAGIGIAMVIQAVMFGAFWALGWLEWQGWAWETASQATVWGTVFLYFVLFVIVGYEEELWMRGYWFQNLEDGLNVFWAFVISSSIFALLHLGNPGANLMSTLGIFLAGFFLGYAYLRTRTLWLAVGLHIGWNFFLSPVFGFPVSGLETEGLMRIIMTGPELWTGGDFGPEAGLMVIPILLLGTALVWRYSQRRQPVTRENA